MAPKAHFIRSAAVELVSTQWEKVAKRAHNVLQEDGSMVLVDPTHPVMPNVEIQAAALIQSTPFDDAPAAKQMALDISNFDAMVAELNEQEQAVTKSQLIDAMMISLNLRKHIAHPTSSIATRTGEYDHSTDLVHYDAMIDEFNEQERPISKAQLIDLFCACSKLRKFIEIELVQ